MTEKEKKFLSDISNSIELIESFTKDLKSFGEYEKDLKTKGAVERHLGIIGEAVNKFLKESNTNDLKNATRIISLRNILIHSYDNVDDSIIWSIVTRYLRPLKDEVNKKIG
ncbi:MAG: HepT-like ribonuclease domain-containing protein [Bacteroidota bacterium]